MVVSATGSTSSAGASLSSPTDLREVFLSASGSMQNYLGGLAAQGAAAQVQHGHQLQQQEGHDFRSRGGLAGQEHQEHQHHTAGLSNPHLTDHLDRGPPPPPWSLDSLLWTARAPSSLLESATSSKAPSFDFDSGAKALSTGIVLLFCFLLGVFVLTGSDQRIGVRRNLWFLVHYGISVFLALRCYDLLVRGFMSMTGLLTDMSAIDEAESVGSKAPIVVLLNFIVQLVLMCTLQGLLPWAGNVFRALTAADKTAWAKKRKHIAIEFWKLLLTHANIFAAIHTYYAFQYVFWKKKDYVPSMVVVLISILYALLVFTVERLFWGWTNLPNRGKHHIDTEPPGWFKTIQLCTNEIHGVGTAFLVVQLLQYQVVGALPDYHGEQAPRGYDKAKVTKDPSHLDGWLYFRPTSGIGGEIFIVSLVFLLYVPVMIPLMRFSCQCQLSDTKIPQAYLRRLCGFANLFLGMIFAWLLLLCCRWTAACLFPVRDPIMFKLVTLVFSFPVGFALINGLTFAQERMFEGKYKHDEAFHMARAQINECTGIAIGTAVEHLFAFAFKAIRQDVEELGSGVSFTGSAPSKIARSWIANIMDIILILITLPVWRMAVIPIFLEIDAEHEEYLHEKEEEEKEEKAGLLNAGGSNEAQAGAQETTQQRLDPSTVPDARMLSERQSETPMEAGTTPIHDEHLQAAPGEHPHPKDREFLTVPHQDSTDDDPFDRFASTASSHSRALHRSFMSRKGSALEAEIAAQSPRLSAGGDNGSPTSQATERPLLLEEQIENKAWNEEWHYYAIYGLVMTSLSIFLYFSYCAIDPGANSIRTRMVNLSNSNQQGQQQPAATFLEKVWEKLPSLENMNPTSWLDFGDIGFGVGGREGFSSSGGFSSSTTSSEQQMTRGHSLRSEPRGHHQHYGGHHGRR
ncbi:unnamed protein product [Amoebophrya sp. A25]|nr:unnamed protein product [Amoebophrya sp. A25]|eukprot:GSA25T00001672001.1